MERESLIHKMRLNYEGLLSVKDLYKLIDDWFYEKNYDKKEMKNIERVTPDGKYVEIVLMPWKKVSDYAKNEIQVRIIISDLKDVEVEKDGVKTKLNQGKLQVIFDAYLNTDYESRWETKPVYYFVRTIFDKYFYKQWMGGHSATCKGDCLELRDRIKSFLNLYRF
jgi:hypothetical protein